MPAPCPIDGCSNRPGRGRFLCRAHWFGTPKPLRDEVWRTWRIVDSNKRNPDYEPVERLKEIRAYRDVTKTVLDWWRDR